MSKKSLPASVDSQIDAEKWRARVKGMTAWEWSALGRTMGFLELQRAGAEVPVRYHPSKLPFLHGQTTRFVFTMNHLRRSYGQALAGWGAALVVAAWYFTDRSVSDVIPNTTAGFWSLLPGWQSGRVNNRQ